MLAKIHGWAEKSKGVSRFMHCPYLCADSHRTNSISLVPGYSAEKKLIGKNGCDDCIGSLDTVDTFMIGRSDANSPPRVTASAPPQMRSCGYITSV